MRELALLSSETRAIASSTGRPVAVEAAEEVEQLAHRLLVGKPGLLERHADPLADRGLVGRPAQAQDLDLARGRLVQPFEDLDGRRLARSVGAEQAEALADRISRSIPLTAWTGPSRPGYCLRSSLTRMAQSLMEGVSPGWLEFDGSDRIFRSRGRRGGSAALGMTVTPSRITWVVVSSESTMPVSLIDPDVAADAGILVDDGSLDHRAGADARCRGRPSRWFSASWWACS